MKILMVFVVGVSCSASAVFEHDRAVYAAQHEDWGTAHALLQQKIIDNPDDASVLYDCGVAAYRQEQFAQAEGYFNDAARAAQHGSSVHEQALFNRGNAQVKQKKNEHALQSYQEVLAVNPDNEHASHNLAFVKKMLEEQKQEQDGEDENSENDEQGERERDEQRQRSGHSDEDGNQEEWEQERGNDKDQGAQRDPQGERGGDTDDQSQDNEGDGDDKDSADHDSSPEQQPGDASSQDTQQGSQQQDNEGDPRLSPELARILQLHEEHDAQRNKQKIQARMAHEGGRGDERNCW